MSSPPEPAPPTPSPPVSGATDVDEALALLAGTVHQLMTRQDALHAAVGALTTAPRVPAAATSSGPDAPSAGQDAADPGEQTVPGADGPVAAAPDTRTLDTEQTQQLLADLVDWVSWLTSTFRLDADLPRCYARHPDLTEELLALRAARAAAYNTAAPPGAGLLWLHELDRARGRWQRWNTSRCTLGTHDPAGAAAAQRTVGPAAPAARPAEEQWPDRSLTAPSGPPSAPATGAAMQWDAHTRAWR